MCETDFSGYPDCRRDTLDAMETALNLGMAQDFAIETPLMRLTKAQTWALAKGLGGEALVELIVDGEPHLLPGRPRDAARLGLWLRDLPGLRAARRGWDELGRPTGRPALRAMTYAVKEIFLTLQGEGGQAGRAAVFCRFAGCNLWAGREQDRAERGLHLLRHRLRRHGRRRAAAGSPTPRPWPPRSRRPGRAGRRTGWWCCTGGEPLLQLDAPLIAALHARGFSIALETNGTLAAPAGRRLDLRQPQGRRAAGADLAARS